MFTREDRRQTNTPLAWIGMGAILWVLAAPRPASCQNAVADNRNVFSYSCSYGPETAFSAQTKANADFLRAAGEANLNFAYARHERARAYNLELDNWVKALNARQTRTLLGEQFRERNRVDLLDRQAAMDAQQLRMLMEQPSPADIVSGRALNILVQHLAAPAHARNLHEDLSQDVRFQLEPTIVRAIRLREDIPGQNGLDFTLNAREPLAVIVWPAPLKDKRLDDARAWFVWTYDGLVVAALGGGPLENPLKQCRSALDDLTRAYQATAPQVVRVATPEGFGTHKEARELLASLGRQIERLGEVSGRVLHLLPWNNPPKDLVTIVRGMQARGLEFAPAEPGDEAAYFELFVKLRELSLGQNLALAQKP
jgi:hypothetical protein